MILAAGSGTRLRPLTETIPKCMMTVGGRPVLEHAVESLHRYGVTKLIINLCHQPEVVIRHFGDGRQWGVEITYSVESSPLGTAGGVKNVEWFFDGPFFVWYGDNLSTCRLDRLWDFHRQKGGAAALALHAREDPSQSGIVGLDGDERITRFLEKPGHEEIFSKLVSAGIFVLEPRALDGIVPGQVADFGRDVFPAMLARGENLFGYRMRDGESLWWIDTLEDLHRTRLEWEETVKE